MNKPDKLQRDWTKIHNEHVKTHRHDLSMRGKQEVRTSVERKLLPYGGSTIGEMITSLPDGMRSAFSTEVNELIMARNYESGRKPNEVRETLEALLEIQVQNGDFGVDTRANIRATVNGIDKAVISALQKVQQNENGRG